MSRVEGLHDLVKTAAHHVLVLDKTKTSLRGGKRSVVRGDLVWARSKTNDFLTSLRMEVAADLHGPEPVFNANRYLLAFKNHKVYDFNRLVVADVHPRMFVHWVIPWDLTEIDTPAMREYRSAAEAVVSYWRTEKPVRPDLQMVSEEQDDEEES